MRNLLLGFRKYIFSEEMNPSMDKQIGNSEKNDSEMADYFSSIADELGVNWSTMKKIFQEQPYVLSHFQLGKGNPFHKLSPWEIVPGSLTPNGAFIRLKAMPNDRAYLKDRILDKSGYQDKNKYYVSRKELMNMLSTGWPKTNSNQPQAPGM
jgi:hypothetical protein